MNPFASLPPIGDEKAWQDRMHAAYAEILGEIPKPVTPSQETQT